MNRRRFLKTTAEVAVTGTLGSLVATNATAKASAKEMNPSAVAAGYSAAEHRRRLENIARCRGAIRSCLRQHLVTNYLPAQCCYNLGEYSIWDAFPGRPAARQLHARWLARYTPLVEEGTWAWLEIGDSSLFGERPPQDVVASVFANRDLHLVLANYGQQAVQITTAEDYVSADAPSVPPAKNYRIAGRSLAILRRSGA